MSVVPLGEVNTCPPVEELAEVAAVPGASGLPPVVGVPGPAMAPASALVAAAAPIDELAACCKFFFALLFGRSS